MKLAITTEADPALTYSELVTLLPQLDNPDQRSMILSLIARATGDTESQLGMSLMPRTLTATYYSGEDIRLRFGPVLEITEIKDDNDTDVSYILETYGYFDYVKLTSSATFPVTVTYRAGYQTLPAKYKGMIAALVGTYYHYPTTTTTEDVKVAPHVEQWYRRNSREVGIG